MEDASLATHARVQYLPVTGEATVGNALPYLNGLLQRRCSVLVAVGPAQVDAVNSVAGRYPAVKFVVVGGRASAGNVTALDGSSDAKIHDAIRELVTDAVRSASH
jgi:hypothetical protein